MERLLKMDDTTFGLLVAQTVAILYLLIGNYYDKKRN